MGQAMLRLRMMSEPVFSSVEKYTMQKKIPVTSNLRYMHEVLNVDKIKN
jgi:hypothetical protein